MNTDAIKDEVIRAFDRGVAFAMNNYDFVEMHDGGGFTLNSQESETDYYNETHVIKVRVNHIMEEISK